MKCDQAREWMPEILDQTIDDAREVLVKRHLNECNNCSCEMEEMRRAWRLLGSIERVEPPAWFHESLMAQIAVARENRARQHVWWQRWLMPDTPGRWAAAGAAATLTMMTLLSVFMNGTQGTVEGVSEGFRTLIGIKKAGTPSPVVKGPAAGSPLSVFEAPALTPALVYNRMPVVGPNGMPVFIDNTGYDTLGLTVQGTSRPLKATVRVLPAGASFDTTKSSDGGRIIWDGTLEPRQSLYIPLQTRHSVPEGMTTILTVEWDKGNVTERFLLYLPSSACRETFRSGMVTLHEGTDTREAIRQAAEASASAFWVDARITGHVRADIVNVSVPEALRTVIGYSGAALEKTQSLYVVKMRE